MELIDLIAGMLPADLLPYAGVLVAVASAFVAATPTPPPGTFWAKVYKVIEVLALVIGKAKDKGKALSLSLVVGLGLGLLGGCSTMLDAQADVRLGVDCTPTVRVERARLLVEMLDHHYPGRRTIAELQADLDLMQQALAAGAPLDPAGDAYKLSFVDAALEILIEAGIRVSIGGYDEALARLRGLPRLAGDINRIEARVGILCAAVPTAGGGP